MKRMGRDNARNAGNIGADPRTIMGIALLSMFIVVIGLINFGLWKLIQAFLNRPLTTR